MTHDHRTMIDGARDCHCYVYRLADIGQFLATRTGASLARQEVEPLLAAGRTVVLDFTDVEAITNAYADELVANLRLAHGDRLRWEGANPEVFEAIGVALERRLGAVTTP